MTEHTSILPAQEIEKYLDWSYEQTKLLAATNLSPLRQPEVKALDVPTAFATLAELEFFSEQLLAAGYNSFNIGLTQLWQSPDRLKTIKVLKKKVPLRAAHGSSFKLAFKMGIPYEAILAQDLQAIQALDSNHAVPVNYDLFFGNQFHSRFPSQFSEAQKKNITTIGKILALDSARELDLLFHAIDRVMTVYSKSQQPVVFEIPGAKGWSLFPEVTADLLEKLCQKLEPWGEQVTICLDLGHILTWSTEAEYLDQVADILLKHQSKIGMIHLSSAGSQTPLFHQAYSASLDYDLPAWHSTGLDIMLPVHELGMVSLLETIRENFTHLPIEVCETRTAGAALSDYWPTMATAQIADKYRQAYFKSLVHQAIILRYTYE